MAGLPWTAVLILGPVTSKSATGGTIATPLGPVIVVTSGDRLAGLYFAGHPRTPALEGLESHESDLLMHVRIEMEQYFQGKRTRFSIPLHLEGTAFQVAVWRALIDIPPGTTATYGEVARQLGRPQAARAVGAANGRNPISIIVPCHRLIGADGSLTGYGWGLDRKRALLEIERQAQENEVGVSSPRA
jgi:methylated-DNA-[protein]-cysteine S-methyltransferase